MSRIIFALFIAFTLASAAKFPLNQQENESDPQQVKSLEENQEKFPKINPEFEKNDTILGQAILFESKNFQGRSWVVTANTNTCANMPSWANDMASSINSQGTCIILYEHTNCGGSFIRFAPGSAWHDDFTKLNFNDKTSSARGC